MQLDLTYWKNELEGFKHFTPSGNVRQDVAALITIKESGKKGSSLEGIDAFLSGTGDPNEVILREYKNALHDIQLHTTKNPERVGLREYWLGVAPEYVKAIERLCVAYDIQLK